MSCERALNFGRWKRVWSWFVYKFTEIIVARDFLRVHSNSKEVSYLPWQNKYPNLKTTYHIEPKFFLWTNLLKNVHLAKTLISVAATLRKHTLGQVTLFLVSCGCNRRHLYNIVIISTFQRRGDLSRGKNIC